MNCARYIIVTFLISLFIFNGLCSIAPKLFSGTIPVIEKLYNSETETEKKESTERTEQGLKELYLNNSFPADLVAVYFYSSEKNTTSSEVVYKKDIHISIPTPPPEFL